jgi:hypothetical protein
MMHRELSFVLLCVAVLAASAAGATDGARQGTARPAMKRYLVEVTHEADECLEALHALEQHDKALFQHVEWGCATGVHTGWVHVDAPSAKAALEKLPADVREDARAIRVDTYASAAHLKALQHNVDAARALQNQD